MKMENIIDVTSEEAITKMKRLAMKDTIEELDKLLQETDWIEFPHVLWLMSVV
jgi:carbon starvation protein CstA